MPTSTLARLTAALAAQYRIERELGAGGMATVYLAQDLKHGRSVAVKVLDPDLAATVGADRFLREVRITAGLQHTNILTLIDSGEADGFLYYVMPFADGESLRARLVHAQGALPTDEALRIVREIVDALAHAHGRQLVHRDIKPENVMLTGGHAVVLDFGVAKAVQTAREASVESGGKPGGRISTEALTSAGTSLGTPAYMAPEQVAGDPDVDHRADLYSVGVLAYELLAGRPPFKGRPHEVLAAHVTDVPTPLDQLAPSLSPATVQLVMRCLEKSPVARPQSAEELLRALDQIMAPSATVAIGPLAIAMRKLGPRGAIAAALAAALVLAAGAWQIVSSNRNARWVREVAIPEIERLADASQPDSALIVATRAMVIAPRDSAVQTLLSRVSYVVGIRTEPAGARISWAPYNDSTGWQASGVTPDSVRLPRGFFRLRLELAGHRTRLSVPNFAPPTFGGAGLSVSYALDAEGAPDADMVRVAGGETFAVMPGLSAVPPVELRDFLIDRYEVTNRAYKAFVDAGGYTKAEFWTEPVLIDGRVRPWAEAAARFLDRTGRPGPATWEAGDYPQGAAEHPVGGVSWYEASAYAKFAGKSLPTLYHWNRAAGTGAMSYLVPGSNFASTGARAHSTFGGLGPYGTFDMAGNVREWCVNAFGAQRFILGGGWSDQSYSFVDAYAQEPLNRAAINGIRLVRYPAEEPMLATASVAITREFRDYTRERPVSDAVYRGLTAMYAYDRVPLDVRVESRDTSAAGWDVERITLASAYGKERLPVQLWIPKRAPAKLQAVIVYPGSNAFYEYTLSADPPYHMDGVLKSGRMVVMPVYAGQYEREHTLISDAPSESALYRDHVAMWSKDLRRTVDYLLTRPDVDSDGVSFFGSSFGGRMAPILLANEPRLRTAVLVVAGLKMERTRPESDPLNFLPRVRIPVLMLNGRYDHYFPLETSQKPFFAMLGTPEADKRMVVYDGGHTVTRTVQLSEMLAWLDKYLGPVQR